MPRAKSRQLPRPKVYTAGNVTTEVSIQSISKAFVYALALAEHRHAADVDHAQPARACGARPVLRTLRQARSAASAERW